MSKLILTIVISITCLISQYDTELFLLKPQYNIYQIDGQEMFCFDYSNMKILVAKHSVITNIFLPSDDCIFSNMQSQIEILEAENQKQELYNKLKTYGIIGIGIYAIITTTIILIK